MKLCIVHHLQDEFYLQQLLKHLYPLQQKGLIEVWHPQQVLAGRKIEEVILKELKSATIIMPLLSADFLAEMPYPKMAEIIAEAEGTRQVWVLPVLLRHCQWEMTFLKYFKILPNTKYPINDGFWKSTDHALDVVVDELKRLLQTKEAKGEEMSKNETADPNRKMAWLIKNLQVRPEPNERGQFVPVVVSQKVQDKLEEYLVATEKMERLEIEGVYFTRAELLVKKAVINFSDAYTKGWKKYMELQNRSFFSLTKGIENLGNTGLMLFKRHQTSNMLEEARKLEPHTVEVFGGVHSFCDDDQTER